MTSPIERAQANDITTHKFSDVGVSAVVEDNILNFVERNESNGQYLVLAIDKCDAIAIAKHFNIFPEFKAECWENRCIGSDEMFVECASQSEEVYIERPATIMRKPTEGSGTITTTSKANWNQDNEHRITRY